MTVGVITACLNFSLKYVTSAIGTVCIYTHCLQLQYVTDTGKPSLCVLQLTSNPLSDSPVKYQDMIYLSFIFFKIFFFR